MTIETAVVNGSESYCQAQFLDTNGNPYTPTSLAYEIDDLTNGVNVVPLTAVTSQMASTMTITITATQNTMNAASKTIEERQVRLKVGIPGGTYRNDVVQYRLINKTGTP